MKKVLFFTNISIILFSIGFFAQAQSDVISGERIDNFIGKININADASIDVTETIYYNFDTLQKHGIYRDIPVSYKARGGNYNLRISNISVRDETGNAYIFTKSREGDNMRIKIGDADKLISGSHIYVIRYKIKKAINFFDDHDELYWNFIGSDWDVTIHKASVSVALPQTAATEQLQHDCFQGRYGSTNRCLSNVANEGYLDYASQGKIYSGESLTIVAGFPKGIVTKPTAVEALWDIIKDNWVIFIPLITLFAMFYLWYSRGRDPKGRGTIIAQYETPDNLTPLEVGTVIDERAQNKDVSAEIVYLAVKGFLKIKKIEKENIIFNSSDYEFNRLSNDSSNLAEFDQDILDGIFGSKNSVALSELKNKFYKKLMTIDEKIYKSVVTQGYFQKNPSTTRTIYISLGVAIAVLAFIISSFLGTIGVISLIIAGILVSIFGFFMPKKTLKGVVAQEHILGLKEYLTVAEKDRIKFHNAPAKNPEQFEKLLPYAMVLGVEKEWAEQFKDIYNQKPSWYDDPTGGQFNSLLLANSLSNFSDSANASLSSSPSSSASSGGSGFSGGGAGGGFGGGGGGSW